MRGSPIRCDQPLLTDLIEEAADISIQYPVHLCAADSDDERVQCIMWAAARSKTIRDPEEILLIDRSAERKVAGATVQAQRRPALSHRPHDREWADSGSPRRGAWAADRSGTMVLRGVPHRDRQADAQPGAARHGLSQALRTAAPLRASRGRDRGFKKASPPAWAQSHV